jgi:potassium efflux system protein
VNTLRDIGQKGLAPIVWGILLACILVSSPVAAQEITVSGVTINGDDAAAQIEAAIKAVEGRQGLDDEIRATLLGLLRDAGAQLQIKLNADFAAEQYAAALDTAPNETDALRASLDEQPPAADTADSLGIGDATSLAELQQWLAKETAELSAIDSELAELKVQVEAEVSRPVAARERIEQLQSSREELAASFDAPPIVGELQILTNSRKLAAQFRRAAQRAEINKLEQELLSHSVRLNLIRAKRDAAERLQVTLYQRTELLRTIVNERRQAAEIQAKQAAIAAELAAADKHPVVRLLAEDNASLLVTLPMGAAEIQVASTELDRIRTITKDIAQRLARSRQHIDIGGLSRITGSLLIAERRSLPQISRYRSRGPEIAEVGLAALFIREQRRELTSLDDRAQALMADVALDTEGYLSIGNEVRFLLRSRRDLLTQAENSYRTYVQVLADLDDAQRRLRDSAEEYEGFLNENLLWIPSASIGFLGSMSELTDTARWALSPESWRTTGIVLVQSLRQHFVTAVVFVLLLGWLFLARKSLAASSESMANKVGRLSADNIGLTIGSLAIAAERALPVPMLLAGISWFLTKAPQATGFSDTFAESLSATVLFLFNALVLRILSAPDGVFRTHFGWHPENLAIVRRQLGRLAAIGTPLVFVTIFIFSSNEVANSPNLGRTGLIILMVFLSFTIHPLVHPETGPASGYYRNWPETWISKFRWVWYSIAVGLPLLLGLISFLGNIYTSTILAGLFVRTVWFVLALVIVNMVVLRWLALTRRKLELKVLLQKREAQLAEREAGEEAGTEGEALAATAEPLDFDTVDEQSRKILRLGLLFVAAIAGWQIWSEIIPAFNLLQSVSLWSQTVMVDGVETIAPVTLADLILALLVILVSTIASRNLPGFMEIAIPQSLNIAHGSRYAITTLTRYLIIMVGVVTVLNIVGWNWSQIQWLVAALSVGLGFGLQEIVANFVSGLVILFERPVRVGDTVTVGQLTGTVSRIRIRATTITDWDRKEIIVPNKSFITEQVVNWTLTDPVTRVVINVGVSYGSDVGLVHKIMSDTLPTLPLVLDEPAPQVYFSGFGDSSLDFILHVYLRQLTDRLPLVHAVHNAILKALRDNGIQIPFPQRDLHIRSTVDGKKD